MQTDASSRIVDALPGEKGFWGSTKRVVLPDGTEVGRICPRCGERSAKRRTAFLAEHGVCADGTPKCEPPQPAEAAAAAPEPAAMAAAATAATAPAAASGDGTGGSGHEGERIGHLTATSRALCRCCP